MSLWTSSPRGLASSVTRIAYRPRHRCDQVSISHHDKAGSSASGLIALGVAGFVGIWRKRYPPGKRCHRAVEKQEGEPDRLTQTQRRELQDFLIAVAGPAFIQLCSEPLAALVDTAAVGQLGGPVFGGMGVAVNAQYSLQKLYNDPLLRTTISQVAAADADGQRKSIGVSLLLAVVLGVFQAVVYGCNAESVLRGLGVGAGSEMLPHAIAYLRVRAFGAPIGSLLLALNGIYRGLGDTRTPLIGALVSCCLNIGLDALLIFGFHMGCGGAALATVAAQAVAVAILLSRLDVQPIDVRSLRTALLDYLSTAFLMMFRNFGKVFCFGFETRTAALLGIVPAAANALTFQLGNATSQVAESLATSTQVALAREWRSDGRRWSSAARFIVSWGLWAGLFMGLILSLATAVFQEPLLRVMTSDVAVRAAASKAMPFVLLAQVAKASAYPVNGSLMGFLDWRFLTLSLWIASFASVAVAQMYRSSLSGLWLSLSVFFGAQCALGLIRMGSRTGPWTRLRGSH